MDKNLSIVNTTLDGIFQACEALGHSNLTRASLHILDGKVLNNVPNALPLLIMPFWGNAIIARSAIPAWVVSFDSKVSTKTLCIRTIRSSIDLLSAPTIQPLAPLDSLGSHQQDTF